MLGSMAPLPVIIVSNVDDARKGYALGADGYLQKPVGAAALLDELSRLTRPRILIIDDDPAARYTIRKYCEGESWQVVRLSRNRMWGHPAMIAFLERFSRKAKAEGLWNGILVGDISQPRGGPMMNGHTSHQVGLDADVWLTPMPNRTLTREEREEMSAVNMVSEDGLSVDKAHWTPAQAAIIKAAAEDPQNPLFQVNLVKLALAIGESQKAAEHLAIAERLDRIGIYSDVIADLRQRLASTSAPAAQ